MSSYVLRYIDDALWRRVKSRAAADGVNLKKLFLWLLEVYADRGLAWVETALQSTCPPTVPKDEHKAAKAEEVTAAEPVEP